MSVRPIAVTFALLLGCAVPLVASTAPAAAAGSARSLCAPPDDTVGPVVTQVSFGRASIDLNTGSRVQTITVTASDTSGVGDPSGVDRVYVAIRGNRFGASPKFELTSGTPASGEWTGRFAVSKYAHAGPASIVILEVIDAAGNTQVYPGYGSVPESPNALSLHPEDNPTFTVTGTPATRPPTVPAGTLSSFGFNPTEVNTKASARRVHVTARFAGPEPARVIAELYPVKKSRHVRGAYLHAEMTREHGVWTGTVRVPRWLGIQTLSPHLFVLYGAGYRPGIRSYDTEDLHKLGSPNKLTITSGVDTTPPSLQSLTFTPSSIDSTAGAEQVTVTAQATDTRSGIKYIDIGGGIRHGINGVPLGYYPRAAAGIGYLSQDNFHVRLKKAANGDWVGTTTVKQCVPSGTYKLSARMADVAGNYRNYSTRQLAHAGITSTVEVTSEHGDIANPYVYSAATYGADSNLFLNFSEGVANVSTSTLTVYALSPRSDRYTAPVAVTGIVCANGHVTVDCSGSVDGLVTSAKLSVPDLDPGKKYEVYANLNQVTTQLTDGNRNPVQWNSASAEVIDARSAGRLGRSGPA